MSFSNMKVGTRLGLGFALVILAGFAVALLGRFELGKIDDEMGLLVKDRMVKVSLFNQFKSNLNEVALAVDPIVLTSDPQAMQAKKQRIDAIRVQTGPLLQQLTASIQSAEGRQVLEKLAQVRAPYNASVDQAIALAMAQSNEQASLVLLKDTQPLLARYLAALDEGIQLQVGFMDQSAQDVQNSTSLTGKLLLAIAALAAVIGALVSWTLTRSLTRQLGGEPDYTTSVVHQIAAGNLAVDVHTRAGDNTSLLAEIKTMRDGLAKVVAHVRESSEAVASASTQISEGNNDLSGRTEEQASALQQTAASMEQLSSTVKQNADNARQANQLAQSASSVALQGGDVVAQVVDTMKGINDSSKKIADIISVIDGIAFQTNILALNAAVEAARAGEQGRGFAVVASEVRSLAGRSADAAKEIKQLITDSVDRVEQGTTLVGQAGVTMSEVVNSIRRVTDIMGEISAASAEQSAGVSQVGEAVVQMDQTTQQNAALVEEMAAAASSLSSQAQDLVQTVAVFQLGAGHAVSAVRAPRTSAPAPHAPGRAPTRAAVRPSARVLPAAPAAALAAPAAPARPAKAAARSTSAPAPTRAAAPKALAHSATSAPQSSANMDDWESF